MTDRRYRALLIGNSHFPDDPDNLPDLKGPINDVVGMGRLLALDRATPLVQRLNTPQTLGLTPAESRTLNALPHKVLDATTT